MRFLIQLFIVSAMLMFTCSASAKSEQEFVTSEGGIYLSAEVGSSIHESNAKAFKLFKQPAVAAGPIKVHRAEKPQGEANVHADLDRKNMGGQSAVARALRARGIKLDH